MLSVCVFSFVNAKEAKLFGKALSYSTERHAHTHAPMRVDNPARDFDYNVLLTRNCTKILCRIV